MIIVYHAFRCSFFRRIGEKWIQNRAIPQGLNISVGLATIVASWREDRALVLFPSLLIKILRLSWIDDVVMGLPSLEFLEHALTPPELRFLQILRAEDFFGSLRQRVEQSGKGG